MDFKNATQLFKDPDFDGDPVVIYEPDGDDDPVPPDPDPEPDDEGDDEDLPPGSKKIRVVGSTLKFWPRQLNTAERTAR